MAAPPGYPSHLGCVLRYGCLMHGVIQNSILSPEAAPSDAAHERLHGKYLAAVRALDAAAAIGTPESQLCLLRERLERRRGRLTAALAHGRR